MSSGTLQESYNEQAARTQMSSSAVKLESSHTECASPPGEFEPKWFAGTSEEESDVRGGVATAAMPVAPACVAPTALGSRRDSGSWRDSGSAGFGILVVWPSCVCTKSRSRREANPRAHLMNCLRTDIGTNSTWNSRRSAATDQFSMFTLGWKHMYALQLI